MCLWCCWKDLDEQDFNRIYLIKLDLQWFQWNLFGKIGFTMVSMEFIW